jgi:hypothetical protein
MGVSEPSSYVMFNVGLVWAVTWQGSALVRLGVSLIEPTGISWAEVAPPAPHQPLRNVCRLLSADVNCNEKVKG